jgi:hypothetical protein
MYFKVVFLQRLTANPAACSLSLSFFWLYLRFYLFGGLHRHCPFAAAGVGAGRCVSEELSAGVGRPSF